MNVERLSIQNQQLIQNAIDAASDLFSTLVDWGKRHKLAVACIFGAALLQYMAAKEKKFLPLAIMGTTSLGLVREVAREKRVA